ncbi:MAG TPA: enoyl-CoA hydratase/isomerase family protein [Thermodesulfobacteriota bacterium]|jgi:enoyl-CoA hydratase/carnithine racemase|nr:enoyl-CoA hydratase/isomerase family protein [Thermodesulfobacteriota bacterium]
MGFIDLSMEENIATVVLNRPKVNAINEGVVDELSGCLKKLETDPSVRAVILTGEGSFFSFGFDIPEFLGYPKDSFTGFLMRFTDILRYIFLFPKPVVAALNGHTIAGGCMLAIACDYRLMVSGKPKISLNEITFGSTVFTSGVEILKFWVGGKNAETILYGGEMYTAEDARALGLIHEVVGKEGIREAARSVAKGLAKRDGRAFKSVKTLLRKQVAEEIERRERDSILEFVDIWYSEDTWKNLEKIKIY